MGYELLTFADDATLATAVAGRWLDWIEAATRTGRTTTVALPGGRITGKFLAAAAAGGRTRGIDLGSVDYFWGDERCVPPGHADSNYRMAQEHLFGPAGVPEGRVHRVRGEIDPGEAAREAELTLRTVAGAGTGGQPVLDLVFLGMGEDGHVASLFPGAPESVVAGPATYVPVIGPKPPPQRVSLTYGALLAAREVWVLASGKGKEAAWKESQAGPSTPLGRVLAGRIQTRVFTDIASV